MPKENNKITTVKLTSKTKERLDHLKEYKRETYEEILKKVFDLLNICLVNPERAQDMLIAIKRKNALIEKPKKLSRTKIKQVR